MCACTVYCKEKKNVSILGKCSVSTRDKLEADLIATVQIAYVCVLSDHGIVNLGPQPENEIMCMHAIGK